MASAVSVAAAREYRADEETPRSHQQLNEASRLGTTPRFWWSGNPDEIVWLEISDRSNVGVNLIHDIEASDGSLLPSYSLARDEIQLGDIVFHFDQNWDGIRCWSRVAGPCHEGDGEWDVPLDGPHRLRRAIPYQRLVDAESEISAVFAALPPSRESARHLPFAFKADGLHLRQTYLAKMPRNLASIFPQLLEPFEGQSPR